MRALPSTCQDQLDVVVIGGGIAGLAAAWELRDTKLLVLEAEDHVGGRLMSERRGPYWLNFGGHVLSGSDSATGRLMASVGVRADEVPGALAGLALDGTVIAGPRVERYPFLLRLDRAERAALIRAGVKLRLSVASYGRVAAPRREDTDVSRRARVLGWRDDLTFAEFLGPLPPKIDAVFRATIRRSAGEPEEIAAGYGIGYFQLVWDRHAGLTRNVLGGSSTLPNAIAAELGERVVTGCRVSLVRREEQGVKVTVRRGGDVHELRARYAVLATPATIACTLIADPPGPTARALGSISYGEYVVAAFLTNERVSMPYDNTYALATPGRSFNMLFNTANVLRSGSRESGGSLMVYSGAELARQFGDSSDARIIDRYTEDLETLFPPLRDAIEEVQVKRWPIGLPHPRPGRHRVQTELERPIGNIFLAGDYLGTTHVETAIETGSSAARAIRALMRSRK
jgi:oxygen-dependent protoporphyrinogen oxidase